MAQAQTLEPEIDETRYVINARWLQQWRDYAEGVEGAPQPDKIDNVSLMRPGTRLPSTYKLPLVTLLKTTLSILSVGGSVFNGGCVAGSLAELRRGLVLHEDYEIISQREWDLLHNL